MLRFTFVRLLGSKTSYPMLIGAGKALVSPVSVKEV